MATALFVGGPLDGQMLAVPDDLTTFFHREWLPPLEGVSWPPPVRWEETVYVRRYYVVGDERRISFSVDGSTDADLATALVKHGPE